MKRFAVLMLVNTASLIALGAAPAAALDVSCVKGEDERSIAVVSPGVVGAECDVQYVRSGEAATPYHADNSADFCTAKAQEIVSTLIASGYACGEVGGALTAEARPAPNAVEPAQAEEPAEATEVETTPTAEISAAALQETTLQDLPDAQPEKLDNADDAIETGALQSEPLDDQAPDDAAPVQDEAGKIAEATRGPEPLAGDRLEELQQAATPLPTGRLVGASPEETAPTSVAIQPTPAAATTASAAAPAQPEVTQPAEKAKKAGALRKPEDIIVSTLKAQAAAWNEGNLAAFMETYWKDDDLKFVSGTTITKGWSPTMKRYREKYGGGADLGQLSFEKTDVEMVTEDVAVVTGRFNLLRDDESSTGVFSLVMRRIGGVWRIVHDHTVGDEVSSAE